MLNVVQAAAVEGVAEPLQRLPIARKITQVDDGDLDGDGRVDCQPRNSRRADMVSPGYRPAVSTGPVGD